MSTVQLPGAFLPFIDETLLNIPHGTQDNPHGTHDIPHGTHDIPHGTEHPPQLSS